MNVCAHFRSSAAVQREFPDWTGPKDTKIPKSPSKLVTLTMSLSLDLEQCLLLFFRRIRYHFAHLHQVGTLSLSDDSFSIANTLGQALSLSLLNTQSSV